MSLASQFVARRSKGEAFAKVKALSTPTMRARLIGYRWAIACS